MTKAERRSTPFNTAVVDRGIALARVESIGPAIDYMLSCGVYLATAQRVLTDPAYYRSNQERRTKRRP